MKKSLLIDTDIFKEFFCCDVNKCKGACCTLEGTLGAPVSIEEIYLMKDLLPDVLDSLEPEKRNVIELNNFYEFYRGVYYLNTLNGNDCVFSLIEDGIALCVFQKLFKENKIGFKKPVSCELFPIRVNENGKLKIEYEKIKECKEAIENGKNVNVKIYEFVNEALIRKFGIEFVKELFNIYLNNEIDND